MNIKKYWFINFSS